MQKPGWSNAASLLRKSARAVTPGRVATRQSHRRQGLHSARFEQDAEDAKAWLVERGLLAA
jgi:hypothetical protein